MSGCECYRRVHWVIGSVGYKVDVDIRKFAANEANRLFDLVIEGGQFEVGVADVVEVFGELGGVGHEHDGFGEFGDFGGGSAFGISCGGVVNGEDFAAVFGEGFDLAEGFEGDAVGGWEDEDLMGAEADGVDGVGVDEVDVVAGGEDGRHEGGGDELLHGSGDGDVGGGEAGPGVIGGEEDGDLVGGLALAEEVADALDVASDVGHDRVPGVVVVEDGGGVEAPAGFGDSAGWRGVGPAVEDELVFAHDEVDVGFSLRDEWRGAEAGG